MKKAERPSLSAFNTNFESEKFALYETVH